MNRISWSVLFAFAAIYIIWGSTYLIILFAIKSMPPVLMSAFRFMAAGLVLYVYAIWKGDRQPDFTSFINNAICGILLLFGGTVAVAWAEQYVPSSVTAIIVTSVPFWFVLLDKRQWSWYFSNKLIIGGLLVGFMGVGLLLSYKYQGLPGVSSSQRLAGIAIIIAGGIAWTVGSLFSKYYPARNSLVMNGAIQLLVAGIFSFMISVFTGESRQFSFLQVKTESWLALLYLTVMGSLVTYLCYLWLLKVKPAAQVSSYVYVNPVVAVLLGAVLAGERISSIQVLALAVILCGVLLVNLPRYKKIKPINTERLPVQQPVNPQETLRKTA